MRSGNININRGYLWTEGNAGGVWSSIATSVHWTGSVSPGAYTFGIDHVNVNTIGGPGSRWVSNPLRRLHVSMCYNHLMETPEDLIDAYLHGEEIDPCDHDAYCLEKLSEFLGNDPEN